MRIMEDSKPVKWHINRSFVSKRLIFDRAASQTTGAPSSNATSSGKAVKINRCY